MIYIVAAQDGLEYGYEWICTKEATEESIAEYEQIKSEGVTAYPNHMDEISKYFEPSKDDEGNPVVTPTHQFSGWYNVFL